MNKIQDILIIGIIGIVCVFLIFYIPFGIILKIITNKSK